MLRRMLMAAAAGTVALAIGAPAAMAAPSFTDSGYKAGGAEQEWPTVEAVWLAGPTIEGVPTPTTQATFSSQVSGITADECEVVLQDPTINLVKTAQRTQLTPTQMRLRVQLDTTEAGGAFRLRDCIWIDDGDGVWEEPTETLFGIDLEPVIWVADLTDNVGSYARFAVNLPVTATQNICDRAARSDQLDDPPPAPTTFLRSNTLCIPGSPDPVVPEAAMVVLLPLTAAFLGGGAWLLLRRRPALV